MFNELSIYGSDAIEIKNLIRLDKSLGEKIIELEEVLKAEVIWAVREEMVINVSDFLSRRRRLLLLDTKASMQMAPIVADLMMSELGKNKDWKKEQLDTYNRLAQNYLV
jgi:glycerol-3-phosphate dehydrogenase